MKALESLYRGVRFRSRMEARWAVFMDAAGIPYQYEPEAFDLDGVHYLPDFYLPNQDAYLEIKNPEADRSEIEKVERLVLATGKNAFVIKAPPTEPNIDTNWYKDGDGSAEIMSPFEDGGKLVIGWDNHYLWCECPHCGKCELQFDGRAERIACKCSGRSGDDRYNFDSPRLLKAYGIARGYRFEPGATN